MVREYAVFLPEDPCFVGAALHFSATMAAMKQSFPAIIWTRSHDDWAADQGLFGEHAANVWPLPCIKTRGIDFAMPEAIFSVVVMTSRKAVAYVAGDLRLQQLIQSLMVLTFGAGTARDLLASGFATVRCSEAKGGEELARHLMQTLATGERVLVIGPSKPAFDIAGYLRHHGRDASYLPIYATDVGIDWGKFDRKLLAAVMVGVICFASPSAVQAFVKDLDPATNQLRQKLIAVVIGKTTLDAASSHFARCVVAPQQDLKTLFATAQVEFQRRWPSNQSAVWPGPS